MRRNPGLIYRELCKDSPMTVPLARLDNIPEPLSKAAPATRRREPRFSTWHDARLENAHGDSATVLLAEVSLHGCRIRADQPWLRTGAFVAISLAEGPGLQAIVRWVRDGAAGMEFLRPIPDHCSQWHELMDADY
jgi:PilZ domain